MTAPLIGFGGLKESGKDTAADFLVAERGYAKLGMSEGLHNCLLVLNPWVEFTNKDAQNLAVKGVRVPAAWLINHRIYVRYADLFTVLGYVNMKIVAEVRALQQRMGTEVGRTLLGENVWVDMTAEAIQRLRLAARQPVALTGVRYPNEIAMLHRLGGLSVWVERPGLDASDAHSSERSLKREDFGVVIENDSTLDVLEDRALMTADLWRTVSRLSEKTSSKEPF